VVRSEDDIVVDVIHPVEGHILVRSITEVGRPGVGERLEALLRWRRRTLRRF